jgi:hypothetical protein
VIETDLINNDEDLLVTFTAEVDVTDWATDGSKGF